MPGARRGSTRRCRPNDVYAVKEANWRVPTILFAGFLGMGAGGWGAGALYDYFGYYLPAFTVGIGFNLVNLVILLTLVFRRRDRSLRPAMAREATASG